MPGARLLLITSVVKGGRGKEGGREGALCSSLLMHRLLSTATQPCCLPLWERLSQGSALSLLWPRSAACSSSDTNCPTVYCCTRLQHTDIGAASLEQPALLPQCWPWSELGAGLESSQHLFQLQWLYNFYELSCPGFTFFTDICWATGVFDKQIKKLSRPKE